MGEVVHLRPETENQEEAEEVPTLENSENQEVAEELPT